MFKRIACIVLMFCMLNIPGQCMEINVTHNTDNRSLTIEGEIEYSNVPVYIHILYPGMKSADIINAENPMDVVAFAEVIQTDEDGKFSDVARLYGESGLYSVYISYDGYLGEYPFEEIYFINKDEHAILISEISNSETSRAEIKAILEEKWPVLGLNTNLYNEISSDEAAEYICLFRTKLNALQAVGTAYSVLGFNKNFVTDLEECLNLLQIPSDSGIGKWYSDKTLNEFRTFVTKRLSGKSYKDYETFISDLKQAIILGVIKFPDGSNQVKNIMTEFKDEIGISSIINNNKVYLSLMEKDYDSLAELKDAYEKIVEENKTSGSTGGGGGGGSPSKPSSGKVTDGKFENDSDIISPAPYEEKVIFKDIDNVIWAKESIEYLYNNGVISGKGDKTFSPLDSITREEFTKLIVEAFNIVSEGSAPLFNDVTSDKWFYEYIKTAYNAGIIKGIGENFGVGMNITRQDMAVVIYNALKQKGFEFADEETTERFTDMDKCSEYAKEAVIALKKSKIINGYDDNSFGPLNNNTRAEAARVIHSVMLLLN